MWFDLNQAGEAPEHRRRIETWLREAIYGSRGFILLWTKAARELSWVNKEISLASENASRDPDFHFIILKLDDEPVPADTFGTSYEIDCHDLWPVNGLNEEIFAVVTRRRGRIAWIEQNRLRGIHLLGKEDGSRGYEPFVSESGIAISLRHGEEDSNLIWQLDYEKYRRLYRASGCDEDQAVDLGIRPGDEVGFFICHRASHGRFWPGAPLWMRSGDLDLKPEDVLGSYWQRSDPEGSTSTDLKTTLLRARRR